MTKEDLVKRYKAIYQKKTGEDLSDEEAFNQVMGMVGTLTNTR